MIIDLMNNTISNGQLYFITLKFKDGCYLGFYSHSPAGRTQDQERGWVVVDPKSEEVVEQCETYYWGSCGNNYHEWRKTQTKIHGNGKIICDEFDERWKMHNVM